jgi:ACS family glucarate transporter-like MFS transporter
MTGSAAANALNSSLLLDLLDSSADAGKATSLLVTGGTVFGLLAPIVTGYVIAGTGSYSGAAFVVAGGLLLAGAAVVLTMTRCPIVTRAAESPTAGAMLAN